MPDTLPHSEEVEAAVIARLLLDEAQIPVIASKLGAEDFYVGAWRKCYAGMQKLSQARKSVDIVALREEVGEVADEIDITSTTEAHRAPLDEYADLLRAYSFRRRMIAALDKVSASAYSISDRDLLLAQLHDAMMAISEGADEGRLISPIQAVDSYLEAIRQRVNGVRSGLAWGMPGLDEALTPAHGGEMIILAARPSIGKTALAEQIADYWARTSPHPILFASLEMSVESLLDRAAARSTGISASKISRGSVEGVPQAVEERRKVNLWYLDDPFATTSSVRAAAARVRVMTGGISAIVIDYLQLLKDQGDQEVQRVTRISRQVKAIAREFNVPVLVLSQLNRSLESREDRHPKLHDLRESGALEQDADRVLGLYRELGDTFADLDILKNRQGELTRIQLLFDGERVSFTASTKPSVAQVDQDFIDSLL